MKFVVLLGVVLVALAVAELVILWRYMGAREAVIGEAQKTVVRAELDQEGDT